MLKERVAYITFVCLFLAINNSLAQYAGAYQQIELHTMANKERNESEAKMRWKINFLSQPKYGLKAVQTGSKALFVSQTQCEIYDFKKGTWSVQNLSEARRGIVAAASGNRAYFAGGSKGPMLKPEYTARVDVYNYLNNSWNKTRLSEPRQVAAAVAAGNKILFAGGRTRNGYSNTVDIFNVATGHQHTDILMEAREAIAAASLGNKIVFAGGKTTDGHKIVASHSIDIFDVTTGTWTTSTLSEGRYNISVIAAGTKIFFSGGTTLATDESEVNSNNIDIYDIVSEEWTVMQLSQAKHCIATAHTGNKVYFAGGILNKEGELSDRVEVYDISTSRWDITYLEKGRAGMAVGYTSASILFAGGSAVTENEATDRIEILNINTGEWNLEHLSKERTGLAPASYGDKVIFAGGVGKARGYAGNRETSGIVDVYTEQSSTGVAINEYATEEKYLPCTYASNGKKYVYVDLRSYKNCVVSISMLNIPTDSNTGIPVLPSKYQMQELDVTKLSAGKYELVVEAPGYKPMVRSVVIKTNEPTYAGL